MNKLRLILRVIIIALLLLVLSFEGFVYVNGLKFDNVFDEMLNAWYEYQHSLLTPGFYAEPFAGRPNHTDLMAREDFHSLRLSYSKGYMKPNTRMYLTIYNKEYDEMYHQLHLRGIVEYSEDECLILDFCYYGETKTVNVSNITVFSAKVTEGAFPWRQYDDPGIVEQFLNENGITRERIEEYKEYFLYEVAIGSWAQANRALSKFSVRNPGKFTITDNTYEGLSENVR